MTDATEILEQIEQGQPQASERLLPLVYKELKRLAASRMLLERPDHTLQATALVHEAYLRLVDTERVQRWESSAHFFSAAAEAMRRILIDHARGRATQKRGGERQRVSDDHLVASLSADPDLLLDIDMAIESLAADEPQMAELVKLRLFAGLSIGEAGQLLGMSRATAYRNWDFVRSWFAVRCAPGES